VYSTAGSGAVSAPTALPPHVDYNMKTLGAKSTSLQYLCNSDLAYVKLFTTVQALLSKIY
jgi:hypothetical protein